MWHSILFDMVQYVFEIASLIRGKKVGKIKIACILLYSKSVAID